MSKMIYFIVMFASMALSGCTGSGKMKSPPGYDLNKPEVFNLPPSLKEVSGIAFKPGTTNTLYAQQDEDGDVFIFQPGDKKPAVIKFGKKGDYEDIGMYKDTTVVLKSDGTLYYFSLNNIQNGEAVNVKVIKDAVPGGEYESLYIDDNGNAYLLCKECDKKKTAASGYKLSFSATGEIIATGFLIDDSGFKKDKHINLQNLKPSALTMNKQTGEWYILSSIHKVLVITNASWQVKAMYPLSPSSLFTQSEGVAFDENYNLYISNEGTGINSGTLLKFTYQKPTDK
jgi:hypothetical protein